MSFTPFTLLWILLAIVVLAMIAYRKLISSQEEEALHLDNASEVAHQQQIAAKLEVIDKWGKLLTIVTVAYGVILGLAYTYVTWMSANSHAGL